VFLDDSPADRTYPTYTYTLISAMVGYNFKAAGHAMTLVVNGTNLADKFYRTAAQGNGRPREIQFTLRTKF
jgi:outer membrane receptor protein involved in Fe transport